MLYDAKLSQDFAAKMQEEGIYVTGFYYPVVPKGQARIRVQLSAGHEKLIGQGHRSLYQGGKRTECNQIISFARGIKKDAASGILFLSVPP